MKKKDLKDIPVSKVNLETIHDIAVAGKGKRGVISTQKKKVGAEETLILNVYQTSGRNKRDISLMFRVFCQKENYITLEVECGKWRTGGKGQTMYFVEYWVEGDDTNAETGN